MNILPIENTNFKAIYKLKSSEKIIKEVESKIIPTYNLFSNQPAILLQGSNPFAQILDDMIEAFAKKNNASKSWAIMNANNHGIKISDDTDILYVFSNENDVGNLLDYISNRRNINKPTFFKSLKLFFKKKDLIKIPANLPKHLIPLAIINEVYQKETLAFNDFIKNKFIEVDSSKDLLFKMMKER